MNHELTSDKVQFEREALEDLEDMIHSTIEQDWIADHLYDDMEIVQ